MWKRGEIAPPLFHNIFNMPLTSGVKLIVHLLNVVVRFIVFLISATLIFRGTVISKCFRESLGIRDNESQQYMGKMLRIHILDISSKDYDPAELKLVEEHWST